MVRVHMIGVRERRKRGATVRNHDAVRVADGRKHAERRAMCAQLRADGVEERAGLSGGQLLVRVRDQLGQCVVQARGVLQQCRYFVENVSIAGALGCGTVVWLAHIDPTVGAARRLRRLPTMRTLRNVALLFYSYDYGAAGAPAPKLRASEVQ